MKKTNWIGKVNLILLVLLLVVFSNCQTGKLVVSSNSQTKKSSTVNEKKWPDEPLHGFCVSKADVTMTKEATFQRLSDWNVNVLTINLTYDKRMNDLPAQVDTPAVPAIMEPYRGVLARLDKIIALAEKYHISIIIGTDHCLGSDKLNVATGKAEEEKETRARAYLQNAIDLNLYLSEKYSNNPTLLGYNFLTEPHAAWIVDNWQTEVVPSFIKAIRAVDKNTYLIFSPGLWGFPYFDKLDKPFDDPANKTLYGFHMYAPHNYTHQGVHNRPRDLVYPGMLKMFDGSPLKEWNKEELRNHMKPALDFMKKYNVQMFVGEFSVTRWAPGADQWVNDVCELFEENNIDWTYHTYTGWNGWNPTFPADAPLSFEPDGGVETETLKVLKNFFDKK